LGLLRNVFQNAPTGFGGKKNADDPPAIFGDYLTRPKIKTSI